MTEMKADVEERMSWWPTITLTSPKTDPPVGLRIPTQARPVGLEAQLQRDVAHFGNGGSADRQTCRSSVAIEWHSHCTVVIGAAGFCG